MRRNIAAAVLFFAACGCGSGSTVETSSDDVSSNERQAASATRTAAPDWLTISTSLRDIQKAKADAARAMEEDLANVFRRLDDGLIEPDLIQTVRADRDRAVPELRSHLSRVITAEGIGAAMLLCRLREPDGRSYIVKALREGRTYERLQILLQIPIGFYEPDLKSGRRYKEFLRKDAQLIEQLVVQLDSSNEDLAEAAATVLLRLEHAGSAKVLLHAFKEGHLREDPHALFNLLARGQLTEEMLDDAIQIASTLGKTPRRRPGAALIGAFARSDNPVIRDRARAELKRSLEEWPTRPGVDNMNRVRLLDDLCHLAQGDVEWLRETALRERGRYEVPLLVALAKFDKERGREWLLAALDDPQQREAAIVAAGEAYQGTGDERMCIALSATARKAGYSLGLADRTLHALIQIGGVGARAEIRQLIDSDRRYRIAETQNIVEGNTWQTMADAAASSGMIDKRQVMQVVDACRAQDRAPNLVVVLLEVGLIITIRHNGSETPRHDHLIRHLAQVSHGRFVPAGISQDRPALLGQDEPTWRLRFVQEDQLYSGIVREMDSLDVERTIAMANRAMRDAGHAERFIEMDDTFGGVRYVFADPETLRSLVRRFHCEFEFRGV